MSAVLIQQSQQLFVAELADGLGLAGKDRVGEVFLHFLKFNDPLFDRILENKFVNSDLPGLADSVGAVCSLVLDSQVPPGIVVDDHIGACEVEAGAARLEGNEEYRDIPFVEVVYQREPLFLGCGARDHVIRYLFFVQIGHEKVQHGREL